MLILKEASQLKSNLPVMLLKRIVLLPNQDVRLDLNSEISSKVIDLSINKHNNEILIAKENNVFEFPGGHLEENETLDECLKREILEETGILLNDNEFDNYFFKVIYKNKDYQGYMDKYQELMYLVMDINSRYQKIIGKGSCHR